MTAALSHWKPDAIAAWRGGPVGLGCLALWSTPEAVGECNPLRLESADVVVTADARIDNREDLSAALGIQAPSTVGDVELIARAYVKWGDDCASHLVGDFAFAVWDARTRRLYCARDPLGVRPFFYFLAPNRFLFGSEIKAAFTDAGVSRELNFLPLAAALSGLPSFDDQTAFKAIRTLEPATALSVDATGVRAWKYWRLEFEREISLSCDDDYVEAFEETLQRAMRARLRSVGRVGGLLSGGLDASTAVALAMDAAAAAKTEPLAAFSWALRADDDWWVRDEREFIEAFLAARPVEHAYIHSDAARLFDLPPEMRRHRDEPEWRTDHALMLPTFEESRRRGVRVLLHGAGGDETVSYAALDFPLWCLLRGEFSALNREAMAAGAAQRMNRLRALPTLFAPWLSPARWRTPFEVQFVYRRRCDRVADPTELGIPLRADVAREIGLCDYVRDVSRPRIPGAWRNPLRAHQIYVLTQTHVLSDQLAAWCYAPSYGVECRFPYLDRGVVEFAVAMPPRQHRFRGINRRLLRRVTARFVPQKIAMRPGKSSTMPDLHRMICAAEKELQARIDRWRDDRAVNALVDVARLGENLRRVCVDTCARSASWTPSLPLCRGIFLSTFLASS